MRKCPYCNSAGKSLPNNFYQCRRCDLRFKGTQNTYEKVLSTYRNSYYKENIGDEYKSGRAKIFAHILNLLELRGAAGDLLDIGTGAGDFLLSAKKRGWNVKGIDPSRQSVNVAQRINHLDVFNGTLREYDEEKEFDVVTFINSLDHSAEPWREIEKSKQFLAPGGLAYIRFPNGYLHFQIYIFFSNLGLADYIRKYLVFHEFSFTHKFIKRLLADQGFVNITIQNSLPSGGDPHHLFSHKANTVLLKNAMYLLAKAVKKLTCGGLFIGTSLEVIATKKELT